MPHYQISVLQGVPCVRFFATNVRIFQREGWCYYRPIKPSAEQEKELREDEALQMYYITQRFCIKTDRMLPIPGKTIQDVQIFEDPTLGIIYVNDKALVPYIVEVLMQGLPLTSMRLPL
jgi:hypothetical protein